MSEIIITIEQIEINCISVDARKFNHANGLYARKFGCAEISVYSMYDPQCKCLDKYNCHYIQ